LPATPYHKVVCQMNDQTILILGGYGHTGQPLARLLLQETGVRLLLAGRSLEKAQTAAEECNRDYPGERAAGISVDASDRAGLEHAFQGINLVVVASSTARYALEVASAALAAGIDYFDVQYSSRKIAALQTLSAEIEKDGLCFITDGGFHPGLPAALVRYAAGSFDSLQSALVGSVIKEDWARLNLPDETVQELLEEINDFQPLVFNDGIWKKIGMFGMEGYLRMNFGREFGRQYCAAMFLEEMRTLPEMYPSLRETGFFVGGFNSITDWVVMPLAMLANKAFPQKGLRPMAKLTKWCLETFSRPPFGTMLKVEAQGMKDGLAKKLQITLYHPDGYLFTAIPVAACLLQYLDGTSRKPGLWTQANLVEPVRLMQDMQRMGIDMQYEERPA
jgi:saccharopine dehydrogenase-like NADP-dependent oxidoreductase